MRSRRRAVAEPLRVLVVGWPNSPHVSAWAQAVAAAGHDVHVAGRDAPQLPASPSSPTVHTLQADGPPLVRSLRLSHELARIAADLSPDIVHAHWLPEAGWMAARERLHPLVCSAWGSDVFGVRGFGRRRSRRALEGAQLVFADSEHLARATRELMNVPVEVVRWGLDLDTFSPGDAGSARRALELNQEGPLVASVRGLEPLHNPVLLLEAFAKVRERRPDAQLLLKTPAKRVPPAVKAAIERFGLGEAVTMLGSVPVELMPDVYRAADVVVSIPSSDSSPRSVWEAFACGRPVVVSELPWARDELAPDDQAVLVPLEADAIASAIERVLDDKPFAQRLGVAARALALAELDPKTCTARIDELYRSVVETAR
jgi:L-malate glycosyltransferase